LLEEYDRGLRQCGLYDPQDRCVLAASRAREGAVPWLQKFDRVVLHALYDLTEAEFLLVRSLIEALADGGTVILFNTTANVKPTEFAEWTWQRFVRDESLAEKTFPEFCRPSNPGRAVLERLFVFAPGEEQPPLPPDDSLRIVEAPGRYKEIETIGGEILDLLERGASAGEIAVVVRHIEIYGEMLEDVFSRYGIAHAFETGVPLLRNPFIKYWLAVLDLVSGDRRREALGRVMSSAYYEPRLSPGADIERVLAAIGYIDRFYLRASAHAARKNSPLTAEFERFENLLDDLERRTDTVRGFISRLQRATPLTERDRQAWRSLLEELEAVDQVTGKMTFTEFRTIASELAGLRTVDRSAGTSEAPGIPRLRIMTPRSLGYRGYKWIFAPGVADGEFPARASANPLLGDETVQAINMVIRPRRLMSTRDRNRREPLYLFMILDSAEKQVTLTYPGNTLEGERIYPSVYVGEIERHYSVGAVCDRPGGPRSASAIAHSLKDRPPLQRERGEWFRAIAGEWRRGSFSDERARELLGDDIVNRARLEARGATRSDIGRDLVPLGGVWHPGELNSLSACPFIFLARHRLKLRAPDIPDFEVPAFEVGILAHTILRDFYSLPVPASAAEARARMDEIVARRLSDVDINGQGPYSVFDPALWKIRRRQLVAALHEYVDFAVRDALDGFETRAEYLDSPLPPARLGPSLMAGRPDHVAVHRTAGGIDAVRIDDFKYSAASSATAKQLKQSFQIPVYAYLAARALKTEPGVRIEGRYLLMRSPRSPVVSQSLDEVFFEDVAQRIANLIEKVRDGKLHPEPADRQDCIECDYRRLCRLYGG
jgi:hypothetical protein